MTTVEVLRRARRSYENGMSLTAEGAIRYVAYGTGDSTPAFEAWRSAGGDAAWSRDQIVETFDRAIASLEDA